MSEELSVYYDEEGDLLEIRVGKPTIAHMKNLGNDVFQRVDEKTGEIRGFSILNFKKRTDKLKPIEVSLPLKLKISA